MTADNQTVDSCVGSTVSSYSMKHCVEQTVNNAGQYCVQNTALVHNTHIAHSNVTTKQSKPLGRFAPSPTGRMHLGNIVAAVAAWAACEGNMLLRIEDVDTDRARQDADRWIMDDLHWLGLDWVGEPQYQSQRTEFYTEALRNLPVYPCYCTRAQIRAASAPQEGDGFVLYPGTCRPKHVTPGLYSAFEQQDFTESKEWLAQNQLVAGRSVADQKTNAHQRFAWRLAVPQMGESESVIRFTDEHAGVQAYAVAQQLGDTILRRSDGLFSYQLAVSVDDALMGVTQVVRGRDLLRSTALQLYIRHVLQRAHIVPVAPDPQFAHIGLIRDSDGTRMAKRLQSIDMGVIRQSTHSAQAVLGICAQLLGLRDSFTPVTSNELQYLWKCRHRDRVYSDTVCDMAAILGSLA